MDSLWWDVFLLVAGNTGSAEMFTFEVLSTTSTEDCCWVDMAGLFPWSQGMHPLYASSLGVRIKTKHKSDELAS